MSRGGKSSPAADAGLEARARAWMRAHRREHVDPLTGELGCTELVEACADALGHLEWLDDPGHFAWDLAVELA